MSLTFFLARFDSLLVEETDGEYFYKWKSVRTEEREVRGKRFHLIRTQKSGPEIETNESVSPRPLLRKITVIVETKDFGLLNGFGILRMPKFRL